MKDTGQRIAEHAFETAIVMHKIQRQTIMDEEDVTAQATATERERCIKLVEKELNGYCSFENLIKRIREGK